MFERRARLWSFRVGKFANRGAAIGIGQRVLMEMTLEHQNLFLLQASKETNATKTGCLNVTINFRQ